MAINLAQLQRMRAVQVGNEPGSALPTPRTGAEGDVSEFGDLLKRSISEVNQSQRAADGQINAFVAGEQENLHEVMISMNQAQISFQMMTEVRNKLLETYHELMRMQV